MSVPDTTRPSDVPPDDRAVIEALVAQCIEAMEGGQDATARVCAERPDLLPRVRRRLEHLAARGLIPAQPGSVPDAIGPYRVVRQLGSGGMGSVYLAEQTEPVRRQVAVKVVKLGMDTSEVVARFEKEQEALALMNHPNIAQVFDAGITDAGRPYFVMEYVEGLGLMHFCDRRALGPESRVQLLATVARAVQHAHERGFVHRDLKPSNVLVAEHAGVFVPKVIDFGIAKAVTPSAGADSHGPHTRADQLLGTPEYMSPEHAASGGLHASARSDVYSLGVVLYELLCGETPFDGARLRRAARGEMERILHDELPTQPSRRLTRVDASCVQARGGERTSLRRLTAGELDWITLKALAKEPEARYATALALAEDLERWLRHEPVLAAPPARTYRLRKFVRRNRAAVLAAAAALVATAVGWFAVTSAAAGQVEKAEQRAVVEVEKAEQRAVDDSQALADQLLKRAEDPRIAAAAQTDELRQALVRDAVALYEKCMRERPSDTALRKDRCNALINLSKVQWQLGLLGDAERSGAAALAEARGLLEGGVDDQVTRGYLGEAARRTGRAIGMAGRPAESRPLLEEAVLHLAACSAAAPARYSLSLSGALRELGTTLQQLDQAEAALDALHRSVQVLAELAAAGSKDPIVKHDLVIARSAVANQLAQLRRFDDAAAVLATATSELAALGADRPRVSIMIHNATARVARRRGDEAMAVRELESSVAAAEEWCRNEPGRLQPGVGLAVQLADLADRYEARRDYDASDAVMRRRIELQERLRRDFPKDRGRPQQLASALFECANLVWDRYRHSDLDQAHAWAQRARDEHAAIAADDPSEQADHATYRSLVLRIADSRGDDTAALWDELADRLPVDVPAATPGLGHHVYAWAGVAMSRARRGRLAEAQQALAQARRFVDVMPDRDKDKARSELTWHEARVALQGGKAEDAVAAVERLLVSRPRWLGQHRAASVLWEAAQLDSSAARASAWREQAATLFQSAIAALAANVARDPADLWYVLPWGFSNLELAGIRAASGDRDGALSLLEAAVPVLAKARAHAHRDVWHEDVWQQALLLRRSLAEAR